MMRRSVDVSLMCVFFHMCSCVLMCRACVDILIERADMFGVKEPCTDSTLCCHRMSNEKMLDTALDDIAETMKKKQGSQGGKSKGNRCVRESARF